MPREDTTSAGGSIRYVEVLPSTGWQRMAKTVREIDEEKVENCKDDIDTLLVFAGLYSAVLSAFNIESYSSLLPDPNDQIVQLLERIAVQTQSYTITSGLLNSTAQLSPSPPRFTAPLWAVHVNGLWFASLIVSLATASLSILVKQWLREFVAMEYRTPQQRLRAHQYRKIGLEKWKVFEIAAVLPLLLQVSLGLFFLGLCIFTAHVNEKMGLTTIPLVSGWAFFLIATALAPLLSPRCPYKLPLLKSIMRMLRTRVTMKTRSLITTLLRSEVGRSGTVSAHELLAKVPDEEDEVVSAEQDDKDLLLALDAMMVDDNVLPTMWDALKQRPDPTKSLAFVIELLISRIGNQANDWIPLRLRCIPDLSLLPRRTWEIVMEMLVDLVRQGHPEGPLQTSSPDWLGKSTIFLLSQSPHPLPLPAIHCLLSLFADGSDYNAAHSVAEWIATRDDEEPFKFSPLSQQLCPLFTHAEEVKGACSLTVTFMYSEFLRSALQVPPTEPRTSLFSLFMRTPEIFEDSDTSPIVSDVGKVLHTIASNANHILGGEEAFAILLAFAEKVPGWRNDISALLSSSWTIINSAYRATVHIARLGQMQHETRSSRAQMVELAVWTFLRDPAQATLIANSTSIAQRMAGGKHGKKFSVMDVVRYCDLHLELYERYSKVAEQDGKQEQTTGNNKFNAIPLSGPTPQQWDALWHAISEALRRYWRLDTWKRTDFDHWLSGAETLSPKELLLEDRHLAGKCLRRIEMLERSDDTDNGESNAATVTFPDKLIASLGLFILPEDISNFPRLAAIKNNSADLFGEADKDKSDASSTNSSDGDGPTFVVKRTVRGTSADEELDDSDGERRDGGEGRNTRRIRLDEDDLPCRSQ